MAWGQNLSSLRRWEARFGESCLASSICILSVCTFGFLSQWSMWCIYHPDNIYQLDLRCIVRPLSQMHWIYFFFFLKHCWSFFTWLFVSFPQRLFSSFSPAADAVYLQEREFIFFSPQCHAPNFFFTFTKSPYNCWCAWRVLLCWHSLLHPSTTSCLQRGSSVYGAADSCRRWGLFVLFCCWFFFSPPWEMNLINCTVVTCCWFTTQNKWRICGMLPSGTLVSSLRCPYISLRLRGEYTVNINKPLK